MLGMLGILGKLASAREVKNKEMERSGQRSLTKYRQMNELEGATSLVGRSTKMPDSEGRGRRDKGEGLAQPRAEEGARTLYNDRRTTTSQTGAAYQKVHVTPQSQLKHSHSE
jgi:hypothetical protein